MFPNHCKEVSLRTVDFRLTEDSIKTFLSGKNAYIRTRFYVFNHRDEWAVAEVEKDQRNGVLQPITRVIVLSLPDETSFVEDAGLEVLSATVMGSLREAMGTRCIVVKGRSEHISFFIKEDPRKLTIFDVTPPAPSKLVGMVDAVLESDLQDICVKYSVITQDLNDLASSVRTGIVMFPCRASGLASGERTLYLDETVRLTKEELSDTTLVGCSLSGRIFKAIYGQESSMVNMCPWELAKLRRIEGPVLVKCCKVKEGFQVDGNIAVVPWGVRSGEVAAALKAILL